MTKELLASSVSGSHALYGVLSVTDQQETEHSEK